MAIEFRCTQCNRLLQTGDDTAGKQAQCPECGNVMPIPMASTELGGDAPPPEPPAGDMSYRADDVFERSAPAAPPVLEIGDIFHRTWAIFKEQWGNCLIAVLIVGVLSWIISFACTMSCQIAGAAVGGREGAQVFGVFGSIVASFINIWLQIGLVCYYLKIARGQTPEIVELFNGGQYYWNYLLASILTGLAVFVGALACIVPGIIFGLMFSQFAYLVVDRNRNALDALSESKEIVYGNKLSLFLIELVFGLVGALIVILTCGLGVLVVAPFWLLYRPVIYLLLTGQRTADQLPPQGYAA